MYPMAETAPQSGERQPQTRPNDTDRPLANQIVASSSRFARVVIQVSNIPISPVSMRALGYIERLGPQRISQMAEYESISQPAMTSAVNRLAKDGLVVREPDPADARAQLVDMTDTGRELLQTYRQQVTAVLQPKLEALAADEYDIIKRAVGVLDALTNDLLGLDDPTKAADPHG